MTERQRLNGITETIIGAAIQVHRVLGPGLLESAYEACLAFELRKRGLSVEQQKPLPLVYEQVKLDCGYRVDLMAERSVVVEVKSVESWPQSTRRRSYRILNFRVARLPCSLISMSACYEMGYDGLS